MLSDVKNLPPVFAVVVIALLLLLPARGADPEDAGTKAWRIIVPLVEMRDATAEESIRILTGRGELNPTQVPVNFVLPPNLPADKRFSLRLANVPLYEVARYIGQLSGLRLVAQKHALVFVPENGQPARVKPRFSLPAAKAAELILPRVAMRDAGLPEGLAYLAKLSRDVDPKKVGLNVVLDVPPEVREKKITLSLSNVPFGEALRYAAGLANLEVVEESYALVVTVPPQKPSAPQPPDQGGQRPLASPKEPANPLAEGAEAVSSGSAYRDLSGDVQVQKSGYIPRRSMGGWPLPMDPRNRLGSDERVR
jgi:hypothetical protein